jgi:hypothetical protein
LYYGPSLEKMYEINLDFFKVDSLTDLDTPKSNLTDNLPKPPNIRFYIDSVTLHKHIRPYAQCVTIMHILQIMRNIFNTHFKGNGTLTLYSESPPFMIMKVTNKMQLYRLIYYS